MKTTESQNHARYFSLLPTKKNRGHRLRSSYSRFMNIEALQSNETAKSRLHDHSQAFLSY